MKHNSSSRRKTIPVERCTRRRRTASRTPRRHQTPPMEGSSFLATRMAWQCAAWCDAGMQRLGMHYYCVVCGGESSSLCQCRGRRVAVCKPSIAGCTGSGSVGFGILIVCLLAGGPPRCKGGSKCSITTGALGTNAPHATGAAPYVAILEYQALQHPCPVLRHSSARWYTLTESGVRKGPRTRRRSG